MGHKQQRFEDISLRSVQTRVIASAFPWHPILRNAGDGRAYRLLTYTLPELAWFAEQFPRLSMRNVSIIADSRFASQAQALKRSYPHLAIATHAKLHSKVALVAPDHVYISSGNIGSLGQHDTTVEMVSSLLHDWYLETVWLPLWMSSCEEIKKEVER